MTNSIQNLTQMGSMTGWKWEITSFALPTGSMARRDFHSTSRLSTNWHLYTDQLSKRWTTSPLLLQQSPSMIGSRSRLEQNHGLTFPGINES